VNVVASTPEDVGKQAKWLHDCPKEAERIAREGRKMIDRLHRLPTRVNQFAECLRRVDNGSLRSAEFLGGSYEIQ
jgi:hypothetical protein